MFFAWDIMDAYGYQNFRDITDIKEFFVLFLAVAVCISVRAVFFIPA